MKSQKGKKDITSKDILSLIAKRTNPGQSLAWEVSSLDSNFESILRGFRVEFENKPGVLNKQGSLECLYNYIFKTRNLDYIELVKAIKPEKQEKSSLDKLIEVLLTKEDSKNEAPTREILQDIPKKGYINPFSVLAEQEVEIKQSKDEELKILQKEIQQNLMSTSVAAKGKKYTQKTEKPLVGGSSSSLKD